MNKKKTIAQLVSEIASSFKKTFSGSNSAAKKYPEWYKTYSSSKNVYDPLGISLDAKLWALELGYMIVTEAYTVNIQDKDGLLLYAKYGAQKKIAYDPLREIEAAVWILEFMENE